MEKENLIADKTFQFALMVIDVCKELQLLKEYDLKRQLFKSATSIGANVQEAIGGASKRDFVAKMNIALKEARETKYWIRILIEGKIIDKDFTEIKKEIDSIVNILSAIVKSTKQSLESK